MKAYYTRKPMVVFIFKNILAEKNNWQKFNVGKTHIFFLLFVDDYNICNTHYITLFYRVMFF